MSKKKLEQQYTYKEVAAFLKVSVMTIRRLVDKGQRTAGRDGISPVHILGHRSYRIPESAVTQYLERSQI